ncbi:MAG: hypothetical protein RLZZ127_3010 [Planctomycetota bacterium]
MDPDWIAPFIGAVVVVDTDADYLAIGTLTAAGPAHLELTDADLHDHREANSTKEVYVLESQRIAVRANRRRVAIPRSRVVAVSRLDDVVG